MLTRADPNFRAALEAHRAETRALLEEEELRMQSLQATARLFKDQLASLQGLLPDTPVRGDGTVAGNALFGPTPSPAARHMADASHTGGRTVGATPAVEISPMSASPSVTPPANAQQAPGEGWRGRYRPMQADYLSPQHLERGRAPSSDDAATRPLDRPVLGPPLIPRLAVPDSGIVDSAPTSARRLRLCSPSPDAADPDPVPPSAAAVANDSGIHALSSVRAAPDTASQVPEHTSKSRLRRLVSPAVADEEDEDAGGAAASPGPRGSPAASTPARRRDGLVSSTRPSKSPRHASPNFSASPRPETPQHFGRYARLMGRDHYVPGTPTDWDPAVSEYNETPAITTTPDEEDLGVSCAFSVDASPRGGHAEGTPFDVISRQSTQPMAGGAPIASPLNDAPVDFELPEPSVVTAMPPPEESPSKPERIHVSPVRVVRVPQAPRTVFANAADFVRYVVGDTGAFESFDDGERASVGTQAGGPAADDDGDMPHPEAVAVDAEVSSRVARILGAFDNSVLSVSSAPDVAGLPLEREALVDLEAHEAAVAAFCDAEIDLATTYARQRQFDKARKADASDVQLGGAAASSPRRRAPLPPVQPTSHA